MVRMIPALPRTRLIDPIAFVVIIAAWIGCFLFPQTTVQGQETIDAWIQQLTDDSFTTRSAAAEKLSAAGSKALPALKAAATSDRPELAFQAQRLIQKLTERESTFTSEESRLWQRLQGASANSQTRTLNSVRSIRFEFLYQVLESHPDLAELFFKGDAIRFNTLLVAAIKEGRWEQAKQALAHPICQKHAPAIGYYFHRATGTLDSYVDSQWQAVMGQVEQGIRPNLGKLFPLIAIMRIRNRHEDALALSKLLPDAISEEMQTTLMLESGDWQGLTSQLVDPADKKANDEKIAANRVQQAMLFSVAGKNTKLQQLVETLRAELRESEAGNQELRSEFVRSQLLTIGMIALDWELVKQNLDPEKRNDNFAICAQLSRYEEAFDAIKLGNRFETRDQWFRAQVRKFGIAKTDLAKQRRGTPEYAARLSEVNSLRETMLDVIDELGMLGFDAECDLFAQRLFLADESNFTTRNRILVLLLTHERFDTLWMLVGNGLSKASTNTLVQQLFSEQFSRASTLQSIIKGYHSKPIEQIKVLATLVRSPLRRQSDYDFDVELARFRSNTTITGYYETISAELLALHGRHEESDYIYRETNKLGDATAASQIYAQAFRDGKYRECIEYFEQRWQRYGNPPEALLLAECYRQVAAAETDPATKAKLLDQAGQSEFAAAASWNSRRHTQDGLMRELDKYEAGELGAFLVQSRCFSLNGQNNDSVKFRSVLIELLARTDTSEEDAARLAKQAAIQTVIETFDKLKVESFLTQSSTTWIQMALGLHIAVAKSELLNGKIDQATQRLIQCAKFRRLHTSIAEKMIPILDAQNATTQADQLFKIISDDFVEILAKYPNSSLNRNNFAWACACAKRQLDSVERHIQQARKSRPFNPSYMDTLASIRFMQGKVDEALRLNAECISLKPYKPFYRTQRAKFLKAKRSK